MTLHTALKAFIIYSTYRIENSKAYVHLYGRLENGESFQSIHTFKPYFFIKTQDKIKAEALLTQLVLDGELKLTDGMAFSLEDTNAINFDGEPMTKVTLWIPGDVKPLRGRFEQQLIKCYEADIRFTTRFMIDMGIQGACTITGAYKNGKPGSGQPQRIYHDPTIIPLTEEERETYFPQLKILSVDIETTMDAKQLLCLSLYTEGFGKGEKEKGEKEKVEKVIMITQQHPNGVVAVPDEKTLLEAFLAEVKKVDPDVIVGWNFIDFDLMVLRDLFRKHKIPFTLGRNEDEARLMIQTSFFVDSKADIPGRQVLDGIQLLKGAFIKMENYKLNTAAKKFLGQEKLITGEARHEEIQRLYQEDQQQLAAYNLKDAKLTYDVLFAAGVMPLTIHRSLLTGMSLDRVNASIASLDFVYLKETQKRGLVAQGARGSDAESEERIKGGHVLESKPGIYKNILVFDFKSLYPSLIRTFNIDPYRFLDKTSKRYKALNEEERNALIKAPNGACFMREQGILPQILETLWKNRDKAKKQKNDLASYAIKILMNSMFGVLANPTCRFYSLDMANAITHFGQHFIKLTAKRIADKGYEVIYGDSVGKDTEIVMNENGTIRFVKISELFERTQKRTSDGKEYFFPPSRLVLTLDAQGKSVFKKVKYVMKHRVQKKMYRIFFTNDHYIDVTEDHSLIGYVNKQKNNQLADLDRLIEVKPTDIGKRVRTIITIKNIPRSSIKTRNYHRELYEFMGLFIGDGSFDRQKKQNYYLHLAGGLDSWEIITKVLVPLKEKEYIKNYWLKKKGDICINGLRLVRLFNDEFRKESKKSIPAFLLREKQEAICSFLRGLFSADGSVLFRNKKPIIKFTNTNTEIIKMTSRLLHLVGISHSTFSETRKNRYKGKESETISKHIYIKDALSFREKVGFVINRKQERLSLVSKNSTHRRTIKNYDFDLSKVIKIEPIEYRGDVYDLEIEDTHRFFANNVLVHNTDSIFVNTKKDSTEEAEQIGKDIAKEITAFYQQFVEQEYQRKSYLELQFEKTYVKFLLPRVRGSEKGAKKRYAGILMKEGKEALNFVGLEVVRRDWTALAKKFQTELLERVFHEKDVTGYVRDFIKEIKKGTYDDLLVYRKSLRKGVADYTKTTPPHVKAARKLEKIDGDIIEYYITTEGPEPVQKRRNPIDYQHYIDKQVKPLADSILGFYGSSFDDLVRGDNQKSLFSY